MLQIFFSSCRTRGSQEEMYGISQKLDDLVRRDNCPGRGPFDQASELEIPTATPSGSEVPPTTSAPAVDEDPNKFRTAEILENSEDLTEDEKKLLWESLFPNHQVPED